MVLELREDLLRRRRRVRSWFVVVCAKKEDLDGLGASERVGFRKWVEIRFIVPDDKDLVEFRDIAV